MASRAPMSNPDVMKFRWQIHGQTLNFTRVAKVSGNHRSADIPVRFGRVGAGPAGALSLGCQGVALGLLLFLANGWIGSSLAATHPSDAIIYTGMADASGAVAVGTNWFGPALTVRELTVRVAAVEIAVLQEFCALTRYCLPLSPATVVKL